MIFKKHECLVKSMKSGAVTKNCSTKNSVLLTIKKKEKVYFQIGLKGNSSNLPCGDR